VYVEAGRLRFVCASPAPLGHLGGAAAITFVDTTYPASIDNLGRIFQHVFADQYADHFHHCYFWQCTLLRISAAPTGRQGAYQILPRVIMNGGWHISSDQGFFWGD